MSISKIKLALLLAYISVASWGAAIIMPALPIMQRALSLQTHQLQWIMSVFLMGYVLGQLIYAPIANRFGRLSALRIGLVLNLLGILICIAGAHWANYTSILVGRFLTALGGAAGLTCTFILINELLEPADAKSALALSPLSFALAVGLATIAGGVITQYLRWNDCFYFLLLYGSVLLWLTRLFPEPLKEPKPLQIKFILSSYWQTLKQPTLVICSLSVSLLASISYTYSTAAPLYAHHALHLSTATYSYWNIITNVGMFGITPAVYYLSRHFKLKQVMLIGLSLLALPLIVLLGLAFSHDTHTVVFFITSACLLLFAGILFPSATYFASNAVEDKASASSMMSFINIGCAMLNVIIMGYLPWSIMVSFAVTITAFFILSILLLSLTWSKIATSTP